MAETFKGKWKITVIEKVAAFSQRIRITGASSGNGTFAGVVGTEFYVDGPNWQATLEWNNNNGSGWRESRVLVSIGSKSPLVIVKFLRADDNFPDKADNDYTDLVLLCEDLSPAFEINQRPYSVDRGTLMMLPDGIFEVSQGIQYMGVKIRNRWHFDWEPYMGFMIGISPNSKASLSSQGIKILDNWATSEQLAFQQEVENGFVKIPNLRIGQETTIYFKVDVSQAGPGKPVIAFVAQRVAWDPVYSAPSRQEKEQIFVSRSTYDPLNKELVAEVPEGTVYMRLKKIMLDKFNAEKSIAYALAHPCGKKPPRPGGSGNGHGDCLDKDKLRDELKDLLENLLKGKLVDPCELSSLLEKCCDCSGGKDSDCKGEEHGNWQGPWGHPGSGGLGDGSGGDHWCRYKPFTWLPLEFEYRVVPNPAYAGQFGPLAFEDPWWKVLLIILAVLLAIASVIVDAVTAGSDPKYIIGQLTNLSNRSTSNVDAAVSNLNGSRGMDFDVLDARSDDRNNNLPVNALDGEIGIDRTDNADSGIEDAALNDIVFKSGARSATTRGMVDDITLSSNVDGTLFTNQIRVVQLAAPDNQPLSQGGDSGSLWVKLSTLRPVALNFAGPVDDSGSRAIANPIRDVVNLFNIHFNN